MSSLKRWRKDHEGVFLLWTTDGQHLEGRWRGTADGRYGALGCIERRDGVRVSFPLVTVLAKHLAAVPDGTHVSLTYLGPRVSTTGREYKDFGVSVDTPHEWTNIPEWSDWPMDPPFRDAVPF